MKFPAWFCPLLCFVGLVARLPATIIGTNSPAPPLTMKRVADLPAWKAYLEKSIRQRQADQDFIHAEMKARHLTNAIEPPTCGSPRTPLNRPDAWYGGAEARRMADCVVSFQTPAGGWSKHTDYTQHVRAPGELFANGSNSRFLVPNDFDRPTDVHWSYVGTFDNGATTTEMRFLARVISADPTNHAAWRAAFARGLDYIFAAQFPNGGWPQVWPLQGGYHDAVTFNDNAMLNVMKLLRDVSTGAAGYAFVPSELRAQAAASWQRGLDCILAAQIRVDGQRTVWCQQHDAITLQPVAARNYEMPSESSSESATITLFLMQLPDPDSNVVAAVNAAAAWFQRTQIMGKAFRFVGGQGRELVNAPGSGPIWSRYYQIGTDIPIFGDRDKTIHDSVNEISAERRQGYGWFQAAGESVLRRYAKWRNAHLPATN
jgi:PelA/Pel-15E family pectate lyase